MVDELKTKWKKLLAYILDRLGESSTVQGIVAVVTLTTGAVVSPENMVAWSAIAVASSAILKILLPDTWTK